MMSYEPLLNYLKENDLSIYDLEKMTGIPHSSAYRIKNSDGAVALPIINRIMYVFGFESIDQVVKYYRHADEAPAEAEPIRIVDDLFRDYKKATKKE